jgi:hypothetical protein
MLKIKKVEYVGEYKLKILFSNGVSKIVDFEEWISEDGFYLKPLKQLDYFKKVRMDDSNYSICWPNGADFCPDALFEAGQDVPRIKKSRTRKTATKQLSKKSSKRARKTKTG